MVKPFGCTIHGSRQGWFALGLNPLLKLAGVQLGPRKSEGLAYLECESTVASATQAGLSVPQYVAGLWNERGVVELFVEYLSNLIPIASCSRILEIGAGTGRFAEQVIAKASSLTVYSVYEPDPDWSEYLARTYGVEILQSDGKSLGNTSSSSQDLIMAHNVFVYLPMFIAFSLLRGNVPGVCEPGIHCFSLLSR